MDEADAAGADEDARSEPGAAAAGARAKLARAKQPQHHVRANYFASSDSYRIGNSQSSQQNIVLVTCIILEIYFSLCI